LGFFIISLEKERVYDRERESEGGGKYGIGFFQYLISVFGIITNMNINFKNNVVIRILAIELKTQS
jgi:hypothetical protein